MESTTTEPTAPSFRRTARRLVTLSTVLAAFAPFLLVASVVLFALPVTNPRVQNCGSPGIFLVRGTLDTPLVSDAGKAINNWNNNQLRAAYDRRCSKVTAARAVPAGALFVAFLVVGLVGALISWRARRSLSLIDPV